MIFGRLLPIFRRFSRAALPALGLLLSLLPTPHSAFALSSTETVEDIFRRLPVDIFENTGEKFVEADKDILLARGYTLAWGLVHNDNDTLIIASLNSDGVEVILHLFRDVSGGLAVYIARTPDSCACEFWRWDASGGLVPEAPPADPEITDFFAPGQVLPQGIQAEYHFCPAEGYAGLEAKPRFWNAHGPVDLTPTMHVRYLWGGTGFTKQISPN